MINIKEKFLQLTKSRTPKGTEENVIKLIPEFKFEKDEFDNFYYIIKKEDGTFSNTMFTSHLDTIDRGPFSYSDKKWDTVNRVWIYNDDTVKDNKSITHVIDGDFIKTDGNTNLGADDKAGVVLMLNLMSENVPGLYYFFMGEESGCVGSSNLSRKFEEKVKEGILPKVNKCISFDRRGYDSVITNQSGRDCCSDEFAKELSEQLNEYGFWYEPDNSGIYTDSAEFTDVIEECTNLSVGYFSEHTTSEKQDIEFLELLGVVLTKIDWENLTIKRDITNIKYTGKKSKTYGSGYDKDWDWDEYYGHGYGYWGGEYHARNNHDTKTNNTNTNKTPKKDDDSMNKYFDSGSGLVEIDDTEFDKWYMEQKNKGWTVKDINEDISVD